MQRLRTPRKIRVGTGPNASRQLDFAAVFAQAYGLDSFIDAGRQRPESRPDLAPAPRQNVYAPRQWRLDSRSPS